MSQENILVTFDIDGTLIGQGLGGIDHRNAFKYALKTLFGVDKDPNEVMGRSFVGCTDMWIGSETIKKILNKDECPQEYIDKFYQLSGDYFAEHHRGGTELTPGVEKLLKELNATKGVHIGLVSGNVPKIGWTKLNVCNIGQYFDKNLAGLGTHMARSDIIRHVMKTAEDLYGPLTRAIHVGDAMQDVEAAQEAGAIAVAVDTGLQENKVFKQPCFFFEDLDKCFDNFMSVVKTGKTLNGQDHIDQVFHEL